MLAYLRWWLETFRCTHTAGSRIVYGDERNRLPRHYRRVCLRCGRPLIG